MKKKTIGLIALGGGLLLLANKPGKTTPPTTAPAPPPTPIVVLPPSGDTIPDTTVADGNTAVSGIREFSKDQYENMKAADWKLILKLKISEGKDLSSATQELWELWDNSDNPYRTQFKLPVALLAALVVNPITSNKIGATVTYSSTPVYPTWSNWWWDYENIWTCADWKAFHVALEDHYENTDEANTVWEQAWSHPDNISGWTAMFSAGWQNSPLYSFIRTSASCSYACNFVEYMYKKGVDISSAFSSISCSLQGFATDVFGAVEDIGTGIKTTGKIATIAIPIVAGVLAYAWVSKTEKQIKQPNSGERRRAPVK